MDNCVVDWDASEGANSMAAFCTATETLNVPYNGPSLFVMRFDHDEGQSKSYSNPLVFKHSDYVSNIHIDAENVHRCYDPAMMLFDNTDPNFERWKRYSAKLPSFDVMHQHRCG
jgi:hypothetical protein